MATRHPPARSTSTGCASHHINPDRNSTTLDVYADLFDDDLDSVAANLYAAMKASASALQAAQNT